METHPYTLPERRGFTVTHVHDEGERCAINPGGWETCHYRPTLLTRLRWALARLFS